MEGGGGGGGVKRQLQIVTWESVVPLSGTSNGSGRPVSADAYLLHE